MRHATCRRALLDGSIDPAVAEHLDRCDRCRAFARDLGAVSEHARGLAPGPAPAGLADRVIAGVREAVASDTTEASETTDDTAPGGAAVADLGSRRRAREGRGASLVHGPRRGPLLVSTAMAAVLLLVVGVLALVPGDPSGEQEVDPLLTAAGNTLGAGTARVELDGTTSMTVRMPASAVPRPEVELIEPSIPEPSIPEPPPLPDLEPPPLPDLEGFPDDVREEMEEQHRQQVEEMRRRRQQIVEEQQQRIEEQRQRFEQLREDARAAIERVSVPREFSFRARVTGSGAVVFPERMQITGAMEVIEAEPPLAGDGTPRSFGVTVTGDDTFVQQPGGQWFSVPGVSGPLGPVIADAEGVASLLRGSRGDVRDLGEEELDGVRVRHHRFALAHSVLAPRGTDAEGTVDAWVGVDDGVVRKLDVRADAEHTGADGFESSIETRMTLTLSDFGSDVSVDAPAVSGRSSSPLGLAAVLDPFDTAFGSSFHFGLGARDSDLPELPEPLPPPELPEPPPPPEEP